MIQPAATDNNDPAGSTAPLRRRRRWPVVAAIVFFVLIILGGGGFVAASALEEHDTFCISCHTVPETTYYNRAQMALDSVSPIKDLATDHYHLYQKDNKGTFECIDCHRGDSSFSQRISTLVLGGRDALIYVVGREDPTIEKTQTAEGWLPNAACVACHSDTLLRLAGVQNHFHNHLAQAATALANGGTLTVADAFKDKSTLLLDKGLKTINTPLTCTDCHAAHTTITNGANSFFLDADRRNKACVTCHQAAKEGPQDVNGLGQ